MLCFLLFRRASVLGIFECAESVGSVLVVSTRRTNARILISKGFLYERCFVPEYIYYRVQSVWQHSVAA